MRIDVYQHLDPAAAAQLDRIEKMLKEVLQKEKLVMADLSALTAEVQENSDVVASAVTLLGGLSQQIRDLATDPAALQELADTLDASTQALADAVAANTPDAPQ